MVMYGDSTSPQATQIQKEHDRLTLLLDATPLASRLWNSDFEIIDCNEECLKLYKFKTKQEYIDGYFKRNPKFLPDGSPSEEVFNKKLETVLKEGRLVFEWINELPDGTVIPVEVTLVKVENHGETLIAGYSRDLREEKKMLEKIQMQAYERAAALEEEHARALLLLDSTPLSVSLWDENIHVFYCNEETVSFFKTKDRQEYLDNFDALSPKYQPDGSLSAESAKNAIRRAFKEGTVVLDWLHQAIDGEQIPAGVTLVRIKFGKGYAVAGYVRDMREQNRMIEEIARSAAELENAFKKAEDASQAKSNFLASMSHEMRTPLNAILGLSELTLESGSLEDEEYRNLEKISSSGMNLLSMVNDILDISKIEAGKYEIYKAQYEVPSLVNDSVTQCIAFMDEKPIKFLLKVNENLCAQLIGDEQRIKQVLNNVLSNAFKYTNEGSVELELTFENINKKNIFLVARVRDTGIGIREKYVKNLFDNYAQMDVQANRKVTGTGLGLPIAKHLLDLMDGTITVETEYGKGSTFTIKIPQKKMNDAVIGAEMSKNLSEFKYYEHKRKRDSKLKRINVPYARVLVVDDVEINLEVAKGLMKPYGMQIDCLKSGEAALSAIKSQEKHYNAVFMDHMMPGMDGIETVQAIRRLDSEYAKNIPIIALTANAISGSEEKFLSNGFQAFISKPIDINRLDKVIRDWVRDKEKEKTLESEASIEAVSEVSRNKVFTERRFQSERRCGFDRRDLGSLYYDLDVRRAVTRLGGNKELFISVLSSYAANTPELLEKLKKVKKASLPDYAIVVHGVKGSSRGVCAEDIGNKAEILEKAAKAGDFEFVSKNNEELIDLAEKLVADIKEFLELIKAASPKQIREKPDIELLLKLRKAAEVFDMDGVDEALGELESYTYTFNSEQVSLCREIAEEADFLWLVDELADIDK